MSVRLNVIELTRRLVDIPSVTEEEAAVAEFLFGFLTQQGWECRKQAVSGDRFNVFARRGRPKLLLTTHIDTVPPFFASSEDDEYIYGRGACDAKGIAAAMICAAQDLAHTGFDIGLLFVVGEETDSAGAVKAQELDRQFSYVIDGEPTENQLALGHKGIVYARLLADGITAHSAYPERGDSAIDKLIDTLAELKQTRFPAHPRLGPSYVNVGKIEGGRAANVLADCAGAEIFIRTVVESKRYLEILEQVIGGRVRLEVLKTSEPQEMESVEGFPTTIVGYGTDIPALRPLGKPLLFGPGSIFDAHTAKEKIAKKQLLESVDLYKKLVMKLANIAGHQGDGS